MGRGGEEEGERREERSEEEERGIKQQHCKKKTKMFGWSFRSTAYLNFF